MFTGLGRLATRHPWLVILGWIVVSVVIIATAPKLSATSDQSEFLPSKYESIRAANLQTEAFPQQNGVGAILVFDREDGQPLTEADSADVQKVVTGLEPKLDPVFAGIAAQPPSQNGLVQIAVVGIAKDKNPYDPAAIDAAKQLRVDGQALVDGTDLRLGITGAAAQALDSQEASANAEAIVGIATVAPDPGAADRDLPQRDPRRPADPRDRPGLPGRGRPDRRRQQASSTSRPTARSR